MTILQRLLRHFEPDSTVSSTFRASMVRTNIERLFWIGLVSLPVHLAHVALFLVYEAGNPAESRWRTGIITFHMVMGLFMAILAMVTRQLLRHPGHHRAELTTQWTALVTFLCAAAVVVTIDQWVTPTITPFLVVCTVTGAFFLLPPLQAISVYVSAYLLFSLLIGLNQPDPAILLSNRVNGITAIAIALGLSLILWRHAVVRAGQDALLAKQQAALEHSNRELEQLATHDPLTGLPNRRGFEQQINAEIIQMRRHQYESCLLLIDLDRFKEINDRHGHPAGDVLLTELAALLRRNLREADALARWGGEEFIILLRHTDLTGAWRVAEQLRNRVRQHRFYIAKQSLTVTTSIGISLLDAAAGETFEQAYQRADRALYRAKQGGRNCCVQQDPLPGSGSDRPEQDRQRG